VVQVLLEEVGIVSLAPGQVIRADFLNQVLRALREATSVISGLGVEPTSPPSMNVIVRAGTAVIRGSIVSLLSDTLVAIPAPDPVYPRFDLITLKSAGSVGYYTGSPEAPVCVDSMKPETCVKPRPLPTPAGELALAEVWVPPGATAIDKIIDRRIMTASAGFGTLLTTGSATVKGTLSVGDIVFRNGWRIVEDENSGLLLVSPSGKRYRFVLQEVVE
jgi:hypothetical protein